MPSVRRVLLGIAALVAVTVVGTIGYLVLGFSVLEALYQTVTTVATVGFREVHPLSTAGQLFTMALIIVGVSVVLYNITVYMEAITEGHLRRHFERRQMDKRIAAMSGHVIVCGLGRVGLSARDYLLATGSEVVVVDINPERLVDVREPHLVGDVTNDDVLVEAGIGRARALIACLQTDADTLYLTLSARALRPDLIIIARARTVGSKEKMVLAGATRAVNPQLIGGRRIAAFALQTHVAEFLDVVMHDEELDFRIQQVDVPSSGPAVGLTLGEAQLESRSGARLLAFRSGPGHPFVANPTAGTRLTPASVLIALGTQPQVEALAAIVGSAAE